MKRAEIIVVGGGIAGLSAAYHLARSGERVTLLEREPFLASHSSGRNAAIFRLLDLSAGVLDLALRSAQILDGLLPDSQGGWLRRCGMLYLGRTSQPLDPLLALARERKLSHRLFDRKELARLAPELADGDARVGLLAKGDGILDIHAMTSALAAAARAAGAAIRTGASVDEIQARGARAAGVRLAGGETLDADAVVIAAGAWAGRMGAAAGAALPLTPMRRHLALLESKRPISPEKPVVWAIDDEAYYRPESGGVLASPCDEGSFEPCLPPESPAALELLAEKLGRLAPPLAQAGVRRSWACLRTFAPDRALVCGEDPRISQLFWLAGLGGHGMTAGVAAGEVLAALVRGSGHPLAHHFAPARLLAP